MNSMMGWDGCGHLHFTGICGVGMAGLAFLLAQRGWRVTGCDTHASGHLREWLENSGIRVTQGHDAAHLEDVDRVVITAAMPLSNPEIQAARDLGIPVLRRGEVLASLVSESSSVIICGTHGKTTTTCFATRLLQGLGACPGWCIGGHTRTLEGVAGHGSGPLVAEADESDGTLALYAPAITVVTNIDQDHLERFTDESSLTACFQEVVTRTRKGVAACRDDPRAWSVATSSKLPVLSFGFSPEAELRAANTHYHQASASFDLSFAGGVIGRARIGVTGEHNVRNALAAFAAALLLGYEPRKIFEQLSMSCAELPARRFEIIFAADNISLISDYAHHPVAIKAAISMALTQGARRVVVCFQPHRYSRTKLLINKFPPAFAGADHVVLLPTFAASEAPLEGGGVFDLYQRFASDSLWRGRVSLARSLDECRGFLARFVEEGDLIMMIGAGDVTQLVDDVHEDLADREYRKSKEGAFATELAMIPDLHVTHFGSLRPWSFLRVGGKARLLIEIADLDALSAVLRLCSRHDVPWRIAGLGANSWFSDLGEPGCVLRFADGAACEAVVRDDVIEVGCGWSGPALLNHLEALGFSGWEFMEGIPGSVGGWLSMNAGAHGKAISSIVEWIRCLNSAGELTIIGHSECGFAYRECKGLAGCVALSCGLRVEEANSNTIAARRAAYREARVAIAGVRTVGSVFRNPAGQFAGHLLEEAGCKGMRVGGARVLKRHANIIAVDDTATASDVLALVLLMRERVLAYSGVGLRPEVCGLGRLDELY